MEKQFVQKHLDVTKRRGWGMGLVIKTNVDKVEEALDFILEVNGI